MYAPYYVIILETYFVLRCRNTQKAPPSRYNRKPKKVYPVFAWGGSLSATIIVGLIEVFAPASWLKPNLGSYSCWFHGQWVVVMYFYGPVGCLLIVNFASFAWTSVGLFRLQKSLSENGPSSSGGKHLWRRHSKNRCQAKLNDVKQRLCLHLKLFGVMGLSWAFELLAWAFGTTSSSSGPSASTSLAASLEDDSGTSMSGGCWSWYFITDMINALQGLWIFIIYVVKKDVIKKLWDKICKNNRRLRIHARTPTKEAAASGDMNAEAAVEAVAVATSMRLSTTTITKIPTLSSRSCSSTTKDVLANNSS